MRKALDEVVEWSAAALGLALGLVAWLALAAAAFLLAWLLAGRVGLLWL